MKNPEAIYFQSKGFPEFRFLSNFHMAPFTIGTHTYPSVEHYYQAAKAIDGETFKYVLAAPTPAEAMRRGRGIKSGGWNPEAWEKQKCHFMRVGCRAKFDQHPDLSAMLKETYPFELVEFAPWGDTFWGVDKNYEGQNNLGIILMEIRMDLIKGAM